MRLFRVMTDYSGLRLFRVLSQPASLIVPCEGNTPLHDPPAHTPSTPPPDAGLRPNVKLHSSGPWAEGDPMPWPHNVPKLPGHILSSVICEDPELEAPNTPVVEPERETLQ